MPNSTTPLPYWRLSSFYFFYFAFLGAWMPFWPLYLLEKKLGAWEIGFLVGVMMVTKVIAPNIWGWIADVTGKRLKIIRLGAFIAFISFLLIFVDQSFEWLVFITILYSFFWNAMLAQFEVLTLAHLRTEHQRYSQVRVWGSFGFISAVALLGFIFDSISLNWLPWVMATLLAGIWLSSLSIGEPDTNDKHIAEKESLGQLLKQPFVICFFVSCFLLQVSHGPYYTFFSVFLESNGYSRSVTGLLWSLAVASEVVLFMVMHKLLSRFSLRRIMLASLLLSTVRWLLIAFYVDSWPVLIIAQCLHAASFGSYHVVAVEWVRRVFFGSTQGQGMALYSGLSFGSGGAVGAVLSGWAWSINPQMTFVAAAAIAGVAVLITWLPLANHRVMQKRSAV